MSSSKPRKRVKRTKKTRKTKIEPGVLKRTHDPWARERLQKRVLNWMWRLKPYAQDLITDQCGNCQMNGRCNRIPLDRKITAAVLSGKPCPDQKSLWNGILSKNAEPYDWGF